MAEHVHTTTASLPIDHRSPSPDWADSPLESAGLVVGVTAVALLAATYPVPAAAVAVGWLLQRLARR